MTGHEQTPLDPAEVMAKHEYHIPVTAKGLASGGGWFCGKTCVVPVKEHCLIYRLAAELAAAERREHEALDAIGAGAAAHGADRIALAAAREREADAWDKGATFVQLRLRSMLPPSVLANPYRAALAGEDAAVQCCDQHGRNCEPPSELCCERCTEVCHGMHTCAGRVVGSHHDGSTCSNPDLSGFGEGAADQPTIEIGGQVMTQAQFDAARFPLLSGDPGPTVEGDEQVVTFAGEGAAELNMCLACGKRHSGNCVLVSADQPRQVYGADGDPTVWIDR